MTGQVRTGQVRTCQVRTGQVMTGPKFFLELNFFGPNTFLDLKSFCTQDALENGV